MPRTIALLALVAVFWPHVAALGCAPESAAASAARPATSHHDAAAAPRSGHEHTHGPGIWSDAEAPAGTQQCAMVMACGLVMLQANPAAAAAARPAGLFAGGLVSVAALEAAILVGDPPPPRPSA
ncbi:MAG TPA: hypothetical protein VLA09_00640 [Longimicrobiales bacterium]|nr:hypothetical protein [Longimicrobiales bacterium]